MKKSILLILCIVLFASWYDPILDVFTNATTATIDTANDWLLFHDVTDGKKKKVNPDDIFGAVVSSSWSNTVTISTGTDTLLNSANGYGFFHRIGNVVSFTLQIHVGLGTSGDPETVYISPPVSSDFTASTDVIGTASMDTQSLSSANTAKQRCFLFASDTDDKIGVSYDPVASLAYPENRMYISVSGQYIVQ